MHILECSSIHWILHHAFWHLINISSRKSLVFLRVTLRPTWHNCKHAGFCWADFTCRTFRNRKGKNFGLIKGLVGGFNPLEKHSSNWIISPSRGQNENYFKPPPTRCFLSISGSEIWTVKLGRFDPTIVAIRIRHVKKNTNIPEV